MLQITNFDECTNLAEIARHKLQIVSNLQMTYDALNNDKLLYGKLSFDIVGVAFDVYNEIGGSQYEKNIQAAVAIGLDKKGMKFEREVKTPVIYQGIMVGWYYLDFLIEDTIILEIKRGSKFTPQDFKQVKAYLEANNLKLGILVLFTSTGVRFTRVLNIY